MKHQRKNKHVTLSNFSSATAIPDSIKTTLIYSDYFAIAPGATTGQYVFRGNSLFDPDYTSTGHQPFYYDQLSAMYSRYRVYGSSIFVEFMNNQSDTPVSLVVIPNTDIITVTPSVYFEEHPRAKPAKLLGVSGRLTSSVRHAATTSQICGLRGSQINDQDFSALTGANPASIWYWTIAARSLNPSNLVITCKVTLKYDCEFFERIDPNASVTKSEELPKELRKAWHAGGEPVMQPTQVEVTNPVLEVRLNQSNRKI